MLMAAPVVRITGMTPVLDWKLAGHNDTEGSVYDDDTDGGVYDCDTEGSVYYDDTDAGFYDGDEYYNDDHADAGSSDYSPGLEAG